MGNYLDRRQANSQNEGGNGIREVDLAEYAAGRMASIFHYYGYAATGDSDASGNDGASVYRRTGLDTPALPYSVPINAAKPGNAMARVYWLVTDATAGNRSLSLSFYGHNQFGNPVREDVTFTNVPPSTNPATTNFVGGVLTPVGSLAQVLGTRIFMRVTGCVITSRTNIAPGDRLTVFASASLNPIFGLPIRSLAGQKTDTNIYQAGDTYDVLAANIANSLLTGFGYGCINLMQQGAVLSQVNPADYSLQFFRGTAGGSVTDPYNLGLQDILGGSLNVICRTTRSAGRPIKKFGYNAVKSW